MYSLRTFARFAAVGVFGTAAHYVVLLILVEVFLVSVLIASMLGFVCGALVNYVLNRRYTFESDARHRVALPRFFLIALVGAGINALLVTLLLSGAGIHYLIAQVVATCAVLVWNFAANTRWTFRT